MMRREKEITLTQVNDNKKRGRKRKRKREKSSLTEGGKESNACLTRALNGTEGSQKNQEEWQLKRRERKRKRE